MLNVVVLQGRLTADPVVKENKNGGSFVTFTIASSSGRKDQFGNPITYFFDCLAGGKTADFIATYWHKGKEINVTGSLRQDKWVDAKSGANRSAVKINVEHADFCGPKDAEYQNLDSAPQATQATNEKSGSDNSNGFDGFMDIPDGMQDELPFV